MSIDRDGTLIKLLPTWINLHDGKFFNAEQLALLGRDTTEIEPLELAGRVAARELRQFVDGFIMESKLIDREQERDERIRSGRVA